MPRPLRIEDAGAIYPVMNRGDRPEAISRDDEDRATFLHTLGEACGKTGWQLHAWCLMGKHFHLVRETPQANLVAGRGWLLGACTGRFNRRHRLRGPLSGGRYKAQHIAGRSGADLVTACDSVHLNPARAGPAARGDAPAAAGDRGALGDGERELPVGPAEIASGRSQALTPCTLHSAKPARWPMGDTWRRRRPSARSHFGPLRHR